jgi:Prokaryotic E2 family A/ThiF family/Prokaryotic homologs of the JAB domain
MPFDLGQLFGPVVESGQLESRVAKALAGFCTSARNPFVHFLESRRHQDGPETVILDLEIELAQRTAHPIRPVERIAITVGSEDIDFPEVVSVRDDFPSVPHLNIRDSGAPRSLCLYAESYPEVKLHWTAPKFIERIRYWLAKTAENQLHPGDQPLEPLLGSQFGTLVVPEALRLESNEGSDPCFVWAKDPHVQGGLWIAFRPSREALKRELPTHIVATFTCPVQNHGVITANPRTIAQLSRFLAVTGFDLLANLRARFNLWRSKGLFDSLAQSMLFLVINLPKSRTEGGEVETTEQVAFWCSHPLREFEGVLNNFGIARDYGGALQLPETVQDAGNFPLVPFAVTSQFSAELAASMNRIPFEARRFCLFGAGALGSQLLNNLTRAGFGRWTIVDKDKLLPHNLARHSLSMESIGQHKAQALCGVINQLLQEEVTRPLDVDILRPGGKESELVAAVNNSVAVVDCSASVPVARRLAANELGRRRTISLFLNPKGNALVLLAEDGSQDCRIDWLEMQYYREISRNDSLSGHLSMDSPTRYSNACRSVTSRISQDAVALFASIASRELRTVLLSSEPMIQIWEFDAMGQVSCCRLIPEHAIRYQLGQWNVCMDRVFLNRAITYRAEKLPDETGGILVGCYDFERQIIYLVDVLPSPADSEEWPTSYIRGSKDLTSKLKTIGQRTLDNLEYLGEWHSHPDGCGVDLSEIDKQAMKEIHAEMHPDGLPALMLIIGAQGRCSINLSSERDSSDINSVICVVTN